LNQEEIIVPKGWTSEKIIKVITIIDYRGRTPPYSLSGIPHIRSANIKNGKILWNKMRYVDEKTYQQYMTRGIPQEGDILLTTEAPMGEVAEIPEQKFSIAQRIMLLRPSDILLPKFLKYQLISPYFQNQLKISETGSVVKGIASKNFKKHTIMIPPLSIQKQIVAKLDHILGELEVKKKEILSLIEQNKERIDFFEKNWMLYVIDREIEAHPQRKEWKLKKISDVCEKISSGGTPSRDNLEYFGGDIPWLKIGDLNNGIILDSKEKITKAGFENSSANLFPKNTVLFAMYGAQDYSSGITGIVTMDCTTNQAICGMMCGEKIIPTFLLYFLQSNQYKIRKMATGGAQKNLNQDKLKNLEIPLPPIIIQKQIIQKIKSAEEKFKSQKKQFENIKNDYESKINYINHIQSSILDSAFSGKLLN
jgi:type I restriction enzyme, S subunit